MEETRSEYARRWLREHRIQRLTWDDVSTFVREHDFDDQEYFEPHPVYCRQRPDWAERSVYDKNIRSIAVYWVFGTSESY